MTNLPAYLQSRQSSKIAERTVANLGAATPPFVSIQGGRFTLVDAVGDEEPVNTAEKGIAYLDACLADSGDHESRIFYIKGWEPGASAPPDCWSDNGYAPSRACSSPQSTTCAGCPKAEWGSAVSKVSGKGVPACAKNQKLALVIPGDDVTFLLRVPPNSLKNLRDYLNKFRGQDADVSDVITRISFEKDILGTLTFRAIGWIDEATAKQRELVLKSKATDLLVGRGDLPREGALPSPVQQGQLVAPVSTTSVHSAAPDSVVSTTSVQTEPTTGTRRRGRPRATEAAPDANAMAPFRPDAQPGSGVVSLGPAFGIGAGQDPGAELAKDIDSLFK